MARRRERLSHWKDWTQKNRTMVVYMVMLLALLATAMGWWMLPDQLTINPEIEGAYVRPKEQLLLMHLGMTTVFSGLFWKWPRELAYLSGALISLGLTGLMLFSNLGV